MPKNSASVEETEAAIRIYYEAQDWLSNSDFISIYKNEVGIIGDDTDSSAYTKKSQIGAYYGFIEWEDINSRTSPRRITQRGRTFWTHVLENDTDAMHEDLMLALEEVTFGRNNYACQTSDSDIEPPNLFIRASIDLGYLTNAEFAYLVYKMADEGQHYTDTIREIKNLRDNDGEVELPQEAGKYSDIKPIIILERWGVLSSENIGRVKATRVSNAFYEKYSARLKNLKVYNIDKNLPDADIVGLDNDNDDLSALEDNRISSGTNILLYGVPGSGKSWTIEHDYCSESSVVDRLVFHPDYTNADFIGQILPVVDEEKQVTYEFTPGPFTTILSNAYHNPMQKYILIIEEINRGNAPAIFGEVFQLLDRKVEMQDGDDGFPVGTSEYGITHKYMADFIYGNPAHKVRIPSNLSIIGTMNTSDQNVFTLDTAFQRRWRMRLIENNFDNVRPSLADAEILDTEVTWKRFCETVNTIIVGNKAKMASAEDKRLGIYFVHENDLTFDQRSLPSEGHTSLLVEYNTLLGAERLGTITEEQESRLKEIREAVMHNRLFPEKVIKYLWDDAFKFNPEAIFDTDSMDNLEKVIRTFIYSTGRDRFKIFKQTVRDTLYTAQQQ